MKIKMELEKKGIKPYYEGKNFTLYHGDSVEILRAMPSNSVDMIFADPPYMLSNDGITVHAGKMVSVNKGDWDKSKGVLEDYEFQKSWIQECRPVLTDIGTLWVSGTYHSIYQCGFALETSDFHILNDICWYKPNAAPNITCRYFAASHETLLWAKKDKKAKHTFNYKELKYGEWGNDIIKKPEKQMRSVWAICTPKPWEKKFTKHPTQKPIDLLERIVIASSNKGDLILDPFTGSSTTGLAAVKHGRKYIGIDSNKEYLDLSIKRYEDLFNGK